MPTAFVLSGGGSLGAVQVGMLAEILAAGERPDLIVGTSAGALNGAFFAQEPSAATVERMALLWSRISTRAALGLSWRSLLGIAGLHGHISNPLGLRSLLARELRCERFDQTAVPLHVVCAEQVTGVLQVVLSMGNLIDAVLASSAISGVFPPVEINGQSLVDGMVAAQTPIAARFSCRIDSSHVYFALLHSASPFDRS